MKEKEVPDALRCTFRSYGLDRCTRLKAPGLETCDVCARDARDAKPWDYVPPSTLLTLCRKVVKDFGFHESNPNMVVLRRMVEAS